MEKIKREKILNVPNLLTMLRIVLVPFFIWQYMRDNKLAALTIFLIVQLTDLLDGMIARHYHLVTNFGKLMDPLADKLLLLSVLACFTIKGELWPWVLVVILVKEGIMIIGGAWALKQKVVVQAQFLGKAATVLFAAMIVATLLDWKPLNTILLYISLAASLGALVFYAVDLLRDMRSGTFGAEKNAGNDAKED